MTLREAQKQVVEYLEAEMEVQRITSGTPCS